MHRKEDEMLKGILSGVIGIVVCIATLIGITVWMGIALILGDRHEDCF